MASLGSRIVKVIKGLVGALLLIFSILLLFSSFYSSILSFFSDPVKKTMLFLSDVLLVLVILELAKTIFSFLENDEAYLHSILETSFIAVLREVILVEVKGLDVYKGIVLALLIFVIGYVYYKMYRGGD